MKKTIILVHFGRSGSTVLGRMLDQNSAISWKAEFLTMHAKQNPEASLDLNAIRELQRSYTKNDSEVYSGYEVKYINFLQENVKATIYEYLDAQAKAGAHLFFLRRQNTLARIASVQKALATQQWHRRVGASQEDHIQTANDVRLAVDSLKDFDTGVGPDQLTRVLDQACNIERKVRDYVVCTLRGLELTYEGDVLPDPRIGYRRMCDHLHLPYEIERASCRERVYTKV